MTKLQTDKYSGKLVQLTYTTRTGNYSQTGMIISQTDNYIVFRITGIQKPKKITYERIVNINRAGK